MRESKKLEVSCLKLGLARQHREVLRGINATFKPYELTAVVGPNGAGKSSLLNCLAGVLAPTAGQIEFDGRPVQCLSATQRARFCAYLPQAETPAWRLAAADLVALGLLPWGQPADSAARVTHALKLVDGLQFARRPVTQLSGGELRRVQIARLLVGEAPLLVADEPTAALDIRHQLQLMQTFRKLADAGHTVVLALHDLSLAARFCDRILLLQDGRLLAQGVPEDVFTPALIGDVYGVRCEFRRRDGVPEFVAVDLLERP
ncbi:ABC transporter ATP-binding protein [Microbulbifer thermotolerans]|uniref:ABC transporter ATP-binding protein n=1 Tax=Microbulbifer thermotolerans TaxID=252514 RepID=A0AB35HVY7_MICTH|nr:ABC transporter ATP-binding protein [Microbulbifer thermotolerans]MCX2801064.1 ABC transporter ATP-binding protein [Microbulbifer thermotolerans]WKT59907.1 ABC transporter ATP-binding protein [Microbulbifer thermotolerans]